MGNQCEARSRGGTWELFWAPDWGRGRQCQDFPGRQVESLEKEGKLAGTDFAPRPVLGEELPHSSRRALGVPGEAPRTAQTPPEPGVPAPNPLSPCYPHTPGEGQGRRQAPVQGSLSCLSRSSHHFPGQVPCPPYVTAVFRIATHLPSCFFSHVHFASRLSLCSFGATSSSCAHAPARVLVSFLWDVSSLCTLPHGHLPLSPL